MKVKFGSKEMKFIHKNWRVLYPAINCNACLAPNFLPSNKFPKSLR